MNIDKPKTFTLLSLGSFEYAINNILQSCHIVETEADYKFIYNDDDDENLLITKFDNSLYYNDYDYLPILEIFNMNHYDLSNVLIKIVPNYIGVIITSVT